MVRSVGWCSGLPDGDLFRSVVLPCLRLGGSKKTLKSRPASSCLLARRP